MKLLGASTGKLTGLKADRDENAHTSHRDRANLARQAGGLLTVYGSVDAACAKPHNRAEEACACRFEIDSWIWR